jgi:uncharacterized repeat protein (TIGR02059 family)
MQGIQLSNGQGATRLSQIAAFQTFDLTEAEVDFSSNKTSYNQIQVDQDIVVIPKISGAINGNQAYLFLVGDGTHTVDLDSNFEKIGSLSFDNTLNTCNAIELIKMGTTYLYQILSQYTADMVAPAIDSMTVSTDDGERIIVLSFDQVLDESLIPSVTDFNVNVNGSDVVISSITVSQDEVQIQLLNSISYGDVIALSYTPGASPLQDASANQVASLTEQPIQNLLPAPPAPEIVSAEIENIASTHFLTVTFDLPLDESSTPATTDFTLEISAAPAVISGVQVSGSTVVIQSETAFVLGDVVTLSYDKGTNPLTGENGSEIDSFSDQAVTNNIDSVLPVIESVTVTNDDPNILVIAFSTDMFGSWGPVGWTVNVNDSPVSIIAVSGNDGTDERTLTIDQNIEYGDTVTLDYANLLDTFGDESGNLLQSVSDVSVTNNVQEADTTPPTIDSMEILDGNPTHIIVTFSENIAAIPANSIDFTIRVNSSPVAITDMQVTTGQDHATLILESAVSYGDVVTADYTNSVGPFGISDMASNLLQDFTGESVINSLGNPDTTAPAVTTASVENSDPDQIVINLDEALQAGCSGNPADFVVTQDATPVTVSTVVASGTTIVLNLASDVIGETTIEVTYTRTTSFIQDQAGNQVEDFTDQAVTNNVILVDSTAPSVISATVEDDNRNTIILTLDEALALGSAGNPADFVVTEDATPVTVNNIIESDTTIEIELNSDLSGGTTIAISYTRSTSYLPDDAGNQMQDFSSLSVTNNIAPLQPASDTVRAQVSAISNAIPKLIIDTDFRSDADDAGALAQAHYYHDLGEVEVIGIIASTTGPYIVRAISAINAYYNKEIEIGYATTVHERGTDEYAENIATTFPYNKDEGEAPEAIRMYRKLLNDSDTQVRICCIGGQMNLSNLLNSPADYEGDGSINKTGLQLLTDKCEVLYVMGGNFMTGAAEWNIQEDWEAAQDVVDNWPTDIVYHGAEIGQNTYCGSQILDQAATNPVAMAYDLYPNNNQAYDLCCLVHCIKPSWQYFQLSAEQSITFDSGGGTTIAPQAGTGRRYADLYLSHQDVEDDLEVGILYTPGSQTEGNPLMDFDATVDGMNISLDASSVQAASPRTIAHYYWDINGDYSVEGQSVNLIMPESGAYQVRLMVIDSGGQKAIHTKTVYVTDGVATNPINDVLNLMIPNRYNGFYSEITGNAREIGDPDEVRTRYERSIVQDYSADEAYLAGTSWTEYGSTYDETNTEDLIFETLFKLPVKINFMSFTGTYPNMPQTTTDWEIYYRDTAGAWQLYDSGTAGWIQDDVYVAEIPATLTITGIRIVIKSGAHSPCLRRYLGGDGNDEYQETCRIMYMNLS